jgi:hypothetical protein
MPTITALRLYNQKLLHTPFKTLAEIVTWMGAVQAQDYAGAKWAWHCDSTESLTRISIRR